jgi:hypothetical protein
VSGPGYVIRREVRDWVALEIHRWDRERRRLGPLGWTLSVLAWLLAAYLMLTASMMSVMWLLETRRGAAPPLNMAETAVLVLALFACAGLVACSTIPQVRRALAAQRAQQRVRRLVRAGMIWPGTATKVRLDDTGWIEVGDGPSRAPRIVPWAAVQHIDRTDDHLIIAITGSDWIVVPARAFAARPSFLAFAERVRDLALAGRTGCVTGNDALRYVNRPGGGPVGGAVESD